jgi:biopolymer transport protein ExbD
MRKRLKGGRSKSSMHEMELNITPMIDFFSIIILFLISSFSATGEVLMLNKDIKLPVADHASLLERSPIITILRDQITLEGANVGDNQNIREILEETNWDLPQLTAKLDAYKNFFESVNQGVKFPGEVIIQADSKIEFVYIKRVLYTLIKHGYTGINLAVRGQPQYEPKEGLKDIPASGG